jgi:methylaspartate mutase epsilon subunit
MNDLSWARWSDERFDAERAAVLATWPTGAQVDLDEAVRFHRGRAELSNVPRKRAWAKRTGEVLLQPLAGYTRLAHHIELMRHLEKSGGASILPTQIDSQTRNCNYQAAQDGIDQSLSSGSNRLNGYPIVCHGVEGTRQVVEAVDVPIEMRIGTIDPRLAAEIAFASGLSSSTAGPIYYLVHYSRDTSVASAMSNWQYVFRLIGRYAEQGVPLGLQIHGVGNSTPFPNTILGVCCALECLVAAAQGARSFSVDARFMGNAVQDVAAARVIPRFCERVLEEAGFGDSVVTVDRKSWGGLYPADPARAYGLSCYDAVTGMLGGVNEFIAKSVEEAIGIPEPEANAATLRAMAEVIGLMKAQRPWIDEPAVRDEEQVMELEMWAIFGRVMELGGGDPAVGTERAFAAGVLDVPFAASRNCKGLVMVARDDEGAVRYLDAGNIPVPQQVLDHHRDRLAVREKRLGHPLGAADIAGDIASISRGVLV